MIEVGTSAPEFTLPAHLGEPITLGDYRGDKNVVLSFHIHSFTGGWTHQVSSFRLYNDAFEEADTQVLGISCNAKPAQTAFASGLGSIPYPILSDFFPHGKVCNDYGVFNEQTGVPVRAIILVDKNGVVRNLWRGVKVKGHVDEVIIGVRTLLNSQ